MEKIGKKEWSCLHGMPGNRELTVSQDNQMYLAVRQMSTTLLNSQDLCINQKPKCHRSLCTSMNQKEPLREVG